MHKCAKGIHRRRLGWSWSCFCCISPPSGYSRERRFDTRASVLSLGTRRLLVSSTLAGPFLTVCVLPRSPRSIPLWCQPLFSPLCLLPRSCLHVLRSQVFPSCGGGKTCLPRCIVRRPNIYLHQHWTSYRFGLDQQEIHEHGAGGISIIYVAIPPNYPSDCFGTTDQHHNYYPLHPPDPPWDYGQHHPLISLDRKVGKTENKLWHNGQSETWRGSAKKETTLCGFFFEKKTGLLVFGRKENERNEL